MAMRCDSGVWKLTCRFLESRTAAISWRRRGGGRAGGGGISARHIRFAALDQILLPLRHVRQEAGAASAAQRCGCRRTAGHALSSSWSSGSCCFCGQVQRGSLLGRLLLLQWRHVRPVLLGLQLAFCISASNQLMDPESERTQSRRLDPSGQRSRLKRARQGPNACQSAAASRNWPHRYPNPSGMHDCAAFWLGTGLSYIYIWKY